MAPALPASVTCPVCQTPFIAQIYQIVDVRSEPELKEAFLRGEVNVARCPHCGNGGLLSTPFLYHDPDKELLLVYMPQHLTLKVEEREKLIGSLVNAVIRSIPPEQRKAYLLQPRTILSLETLLEEVLVADGISRESIAAQRKAMALIQELLIAKDNVESLKELVKQRKGEIQYEFFLLLSASIDAAERDGDESRVRQLTDLRDKLLELTAPPIPEPLGEGATRQDLIEEMLKAKDKEALEGLVLANRPLVDYLFFQTLTGQAEEAEQAGDAAKAKRLAELRTQVLEITDELERQAREAQQRAVATIRDLLASEDLGKAIPAHGNEYDAVFLLVLAGMTRGARKAGDEELANRLQALHERVMAFLEERMPPELRLLNQLLAVEDAAGVRALLEERADELTEDFVAMLRALAADLKSSSHPQTVQRLQTLLDQVTAFLAEKGKDGE